MVKKTTTIPMLLDIILRNILEIEDFTSNVDFDTYNKSTMMKKACERNLYTIGDSCNEIVLRQERENVELNDEILDVFSDVYSFRVILGHGYDTIDDKIVFNIIDKDLSNFKSVIEKLKEEIQ